MALLHFAPGKGMMSPYPFTQKKTTPISFPSGKMMKSPMTSSSRHTIVVSLTVMSADMCGHRECYLCLDTY